MIWADGRGRAVWSERGSLKRKHLLRDQNNEKEIAALSDEEKVFQQSQ